MTKKNHRHHSIIEVFSLRKGKKKFGKKGQIALHGEMKRLHEHIAFLPAEFSTFLEKET